jgi:hypothetical protein
MTLVTNTATLQGSWAPGTPNGLGLGSSLYTELKPDGFNFDMTYEPLTFDGSLFGEVDFLGTPGSSVSFTSGNVSVINPVSFEGFQTANGITAKGIFVTLTSAAVPRGVSNVPYIFGNWSVTLAGNFFVFYQPCDPIANVPLIKQSKDGAAEIGQPEPPWAKLPYDKDPPYTIGQLGCALTCCTMLIDYYGDITQQTDPASLNTWLTGQQDGYGGQNGHSVVWQAVARYARQKNIQLYFAEPPLDMRDDVRLEKLLCANEPVILEVLHKDNVNPVSATFTPFTQPAANSRVPVTVGDTSWMVPNVTLLHVDGGGVYIVRDKTDATGVVEIENLGYSGNASEGATVTGSIISRVHEHFVLATGDTADKGIRINDPAFNHAWIDDFYYNTYVGMRIFCTPKTAQGVAATLPALLVFGHSPVELLITDPAGNQTGVNPQSGQSYNQIASSSYTVESLGDAEDQTGNNDLPESKELHVGNPSDCTYKLQVFGTGTGLFNLDFIGYDSDGNPSLMSVAGNASPGSEIDYTIAYSSSPGSQIKVTPVDTTPPTIQGMPTPGTILWPPNGKLVQVAIISASDAETGVASFDVTATSSEPSESANPDIVITGTGVQPRVVNLRAERLGTGSGRVYTITAIATDGAGNQASVTTKVIVPHDQGQ